LINEKEGSQNAQDERFPSVGEREGNEAYKIELKRRGFPKGRE